MENLQKNINKVNKILKSIERHKPFKLYFGFLIKRYMIVIHYAQYLPVGLNKNVFVNKKNCLSYLKT